jgi:hypothetical protein
MIINRIEIERKIGASSEVHSIPIGAIAPTWDLFDGILVPVGPSEM